MNGSIGVLQIKQGFKRGPSGLFEFAARRWRHTIRDRY
jgi:hypothetical protein